MSSDSGDNPVSQATNTFKDTASSAFSYAGNKINQGVANATGVKDVSEAMNNVNAHNSRTVTSLTAAVTKGKTQGLENTLAENVNPYSKLTGYRAGDNNVDIAKAEAEADFANMTAADQAQAKLDALNNINSKVDAIGKTLSSAPGRSQTLLIANYAKPGDAGNTLLTSKKANNG